MRKLFLLLVPLAALLAGCFTVESNYVVNDDGSGTYTMRFAIPAEVIQALSSMGGASGEFPSSEEMENDPEMEALRDALGDRGSVTVFSNEDEGFGFTMTVNVPASDDFTAALEGVLADLPQDSELPTNQVSTVAPMPSIKRSGDTWTFSQELPSLSGEDFGSLTGDDQAAGFASMSADQSSVTITVSLPGEVTDHNADEVRSDGTLVWTQQGIDGGRTLTAESDATAGGGGGMTVILIVAGILAAALLVAVLAYIAMRKSEAPPAASA